MTTIIEIFLTFLRLGLVSFGGPAAHLSFFQKEFVDNKQWISQQEYLSLVSLSQFLPGPGSSQVGFAIGLNRGGKIGAIAAFIGFTLPSALIMISLALTARHHHQSPLLTGLIAGLKLAALVIVIDAVWQMYHQFCRNIYLASVCFASATILLISPLLTSQLICLLAAACIGLIQQAVLGKDADPTTTTPRHARLKIKLPYLTLFLLLALLPLANLPSLWDCFGRFFQAGSWVFGGGHVVLPLLQQTLLDQLNQEQLLGAYAAAQAVPGPMFSIAAYLGVMLGDSAPLSHAFVATIAIFLPGFLLILAFTDAWQALSKQRFFLAAIQMVNAAVVGILVAALYQPIFTSAVHSPKEFVFAVIGFYCLCLLKWPVYRILLLMALLGGLFLN